MRGPRTRSSFWGVEADPRLFGAAFADGRRKKWRLNHSPLFLDFLEGKGDYACRLGNPNLFPTRLAASLLSPVRRVRQDLPGAARDD